MGHKKEKNRVELKGFLNDNDPSSKWTVKASVFTDLFSKSEYLFQLYQALYPKDTVTKESDLELMILESQLLNQQYNDLGFLVGDRLIILVEAQSSWSINIVIRVLLYVTQTWYKYIKRMSLDVYDDEKITLPAVDLYVIYTGDDPDTKPRKISLKRDFFEGQETGVDCEVKVITKSRKGSIIAQYIRFCHVFNEQVRIHGRTTKAIEETIRICQDEDVLREYLEEEREEVMDIMTTLFDQETIMKNHDAAITRKAEDKLADLINMLLAEGKTDEIAKVTSDEVYRAKMLKKFKGKGVVTT